MKAEIRFPFVDPIFCKPLNPVPDRNMTYFVILKNWMYFLNSSQESTNTEST